MFLVPLVRVAGEEVAVLRSGVTGVRGRLFGPRLGAEGELDVGVGVLCSAAWARSLAMRCLIALAVQAGRGECQLICVVLSEDFGGLVLKAWIEVKVDGVIPASKTQDHIRKQRLKTHHHP